MKGETGLALVAEGVFVEGLFGYAGVAEDMATWELYDLIAGYVHWVVSLKQTEQSMFWVMISKSDY